MLINKIGSLTEIEFRRTALKEKAITEAIKLQGVERGGNTDEGWGMRGAGDGLQQAGRSSKVRYGNL